VEVVGENGQDLGTLEFWTGFRSEFACKEYEFDPGSGPAGVKKSHCYVEREFSLDLGADPGLGFRLLDVDDDGDAELLFTGLCGQYGSYDTTIFEIGYDRLTEVYWGRDPDFSSSWLGSPVMTAWSRDGYRTETCEYRVLGDRFWRWNSNWSFPQFWGPTDCRWGDSDWLYRGSAWIPTLVESLSRYTGLSLQSSRPIAAFIFMGLIFLVLYGLIRRK
jgi:hypothetical protein